VVCRDIYLRRSNILFRPVSIDLAGYYDAISLRQHLSPMAPSQCQLSQGHCRFLTICCRYVHYHLPRKLTRIPASGSFAVSIPGVPVTVIRSDWSKLLNMHKLAEHRFYSDHKFVSVAVGFGREGQINGMCAGIAECTCFTG
jgi:hypothetical protein